jgi:hypothetical protein
LLLSRFGVDVEGGVVVYRGCWLLVSEVGHENVAVAIPDMVG